MNPISTIPTSEPGDFLQARIGPPISASHPAAEHDPALLGSVMVLDSVRCFGRDSLDDVRNALDARRAGHCNSSTRLPPMPAFRQPPVVERLEPMVLDTASALKASSRYYDYGASSAYLRTSIFLRGSW